MPTEYATNESVEAVMAEVLHDSQLSEFSALRDNEVQVTTLMKSKTDAADQLVETGSG